jgi:hypothetical protein
MRRTWVFPAAIVSAWLLGPLLLPGALLAQEPARVALVIGNAKYQKSPQLKNPINDATDMATKLQAVGFKLIGDSTHLNVARAEMARLLRDFGKATRAGDTALFYYAGHGVAFNGDNWLLPVDDADIEVQDDAPNFALSSRNVVSTLEQRGGGTNILVLDACRNNPLPDRLRSRGSARGLMRLDVPKGTFVMYAASENQAALDGDGRNCPFTGELLKLIAKPGMRLDDIYYQTLKQVSSLSQGRQEPMAELKLTEPFYFVRGTGAEQESPTVASPVPRPSEAVAQRPPVPLAAVVQPAPAPNASTPDGTPTLQETSDWLSQTLATYGGDPNVDLDLDRYTKFVNIGIDTSCNLHYTLTWRKKRDPTRSSVALGCRWPVFHSVSGSPSTYRQIA